MLLLGRKGSWQEHVFFFLKATATTWPCSNTRKVWPLNIPHPIKKQNCQIDSKVKAKHGVPTFWGKKINVVINKYFQQPAALCLYSGFGDNEQNRLN